MSKRERIILILMAIAVVYGLYTYLYSSPSKTGLSGPGGGTKDLNRFVIDIANKITDNSQLKNDEYVVAMAAAEWTKNPFLGPETIVKTKIVPEQKKIEKLKEPEPMTQSEFLYTGYLSIGDSKMAIINGQEHKTGYANRRYIDFKQHCHPLALPYFSSAKRLSSYCEIFNYKQ